MNTRSESLFVIVVNADQTRQELMWGTFTEKPKVGDAIQRDPIVSGTREWFALKIFSFEEQRKLHALLELIGLDEVCGFFKLKK